ncbi:DUF1697 domain-containing protein [Sinomonas mesophila]|uniref:DUF1697 domain-containing protein n=1 Tax=Sinomonas mesophila TaxID=1531955 RepID=UPI001115A335|nr:DUF1697 domain-containing protein [Sinomonas mesophila]
MAQYAIFLRGVNVGGITLKMAEVRDVIGALDVTDVATLLASGNIVLSTDLGARPLKAAVEAALRAAFGYDAWVVVLTRAEVEAIVEACPYPADDASTHTYITLSSDPAALDELAAATDGADGQERLAPGATAWLAPRGSTLVSPLSKATAKPKFKATTTTRNLRTMLKVRAAFA